MASSATEVSVIILKEIDEVKANDQASIIKVDEYMNEKQKYRENVIQILSDFVDIDTAKLIYDTCINDMILIPNTFEKDELLKHWFVPNKGGMINQYRDYHRVDLYPSNHLQLIRRGMLSSVKGYKVSPDSKHKLRFECKFILTHPSDFIVFSMNSSGVRSEGIRAACYGFLEMIGRELWIMPDHNEKNVTFVVETGWNSLFDVGEKVDNIPLNKELSVIMIDDGKQLNAEFYIEEKLICDIIAPSEKDAKFNRVGFCNREHDGNACDITYLQLSVLLE